MLLQNGARAGADAIWQDIHEAEASLYYDESVVDPLVQAWLQSYMLFPPMEEQPSYEKINTTKEVVRLTLASEPTFWNQADQDDRNVHLNGDPQINSRGTTPSPSLSD